MPERRWAGEGRHLGPLFESTPEAALADDELVARFAATRGEPAERAFATLVARHGPLVLGVCRRVLGDHQAAEDAFQATFLILARRAGTFEVRDSLGRWLYRVGHRVAARARRARRGVALTPADERGAPDPDAAEAAELRAALDDEIGRLPGRLRDSVVLCLLEGRTLGEAARRMGCAEGTAGSRLSRARVLLRSRLERRGFAPAALLAEGAALRVAVPSPWLRAAARLALGEPTALISPSIDTLARSALKEMTMTRAFTAGVCLVGCLATAGSVLAVRAATRAETDDGARPVVRAAVPRSPRPRPAPARRPDEPDPARVEALIATFRTLKVDQTNVWGAAVRDLAAIGRPALPALIAELDRTTADRPLRALAFTLRAIGDPRAVPALIRAIPRTLVPPGSDYGLRCEDADLRAFLQKHANRGPESGDSVTFGMPFREVFGALHTLTGRKFDEDQLNFINADGSATQLAAKQRLFRRLADRWAGWWEANWRQFTDDPAFAAVNLPPVEAVTPGGPPPAQPFPTGPAVRESSGTTNEIVGPPQPQDYYTTFQDLDTKLQSKWPKDLGDPKAARPEAVARWAAGDGYDLEGVEYRPPGSDRSFYALRGIGLRAWQVDDALYETIVRELKEGHLPDLGRPVDGFLMHRDPATGKYDPEKEATFLFATREGATGILQTTAQVTELFDASDFGKPSQLKSTRGFYRGVQFQHKMIYEER